MSDVEMARSVGRWTWFFSAWGRLVVAYWIVGIVWVLALGLFRGGISTWLLVVAVALGPFIGLFGLVISFPTLLMTPVYLELLRRVPLAWRRWQFRSAAVVLAPPVVGSVTWGWWGLIGFLGDFGLWYTFFAGWLLGALVVYGLIVPLPQRGTLGDVAALDLPQSR